MSGEAVAAEVALLRSQIERERAEREALASTLDASGHLHAPGSGHASFLSALDESAMTDDTEARGSSWDAMRWRRFEQEFIELTPESELTFEEFLLQYQYLKNEVVTMRAAVLALNDEKTLLARELEGRVASLAAERSALHRSLSALSSSRDNTGSSLDPASVDLMRRDCAHLRELLDDERGRLSRLLVERQKLESTSESLMGEMMAKIGELETARTSSTHTMLASKLDELHELRGAIKVAEHQKRDMQDARARLETELYQEKQAHAKEADARALVENEVTAARMRQSSRRAAVAQLTAASKRRADVDTSLASLEADGAALKRSITALTKDRDNLRIAVQSLKADVAELRLQGERSTTETKRAVRALQAKIDAASV